MFNATSLHQVLDIYSANSGEFVSRANSNMFFSPNTIVLTRAEICQEFHINNEAISDKYLGLPTLVGADMSACFSHFVEGIWTRICGWMEKQLSLGGKEILLEAVAQAIPICNASVLDSKGGV